MTPVVVLALHRGPKDSLMVASVLTLLGNWIRYAGAKANGGTFGAVMFGQILVGFAQPFVLAAPTRYSDLWFSDKGRVSATAVATLANPFGGAIGQLISPLWAEKPEDVPNMVLYVAVISSVICIPSFFIPATPPTPPSASSALPKPSIRKSLVELRSNTSFYLLFTAFTIYLSFFNALSSLLNQILYPYAYTEEQAGLCGAVLIIVGLVAAAATSPIIDRTHTFLLPIKILVPIIASSYLAFTWMPQTRAISGPYVVAALLGGSSFTLVPIVLEYLVEITWPASPEVSSTICWAGGQLFGGIFIIIMGALKDLDGTPGDTAERGDRPPGNMYNALVFQTVLTCVIMPVPLLLGVRSLGLDKGRVSRRYSVDEPRGT
ncbi:MFS general substrate transporter [Eremomyces bilateralis CBS 781.70]|uniref:MFS general substrate transporter n=1 Tax=Eremomyces bilateralis CBS 781.70 TaxID=1392243 RepID=A0A6G1G6Z7_9PEZI|nr:MFS general substrate transporter [Eremomyces bilateralis CBS 781.70]KAF1813804.1 MFS general substrate transporter [Eremomyces bilateralis CBS 781.70]